MARNIAIPVISDSTRKSSRCRVVGRGIQERDLQRPAGSWSGIYRLQTDALQMIKDFVVSCTRKIQHLVSRNCQEGINASKGRVAAPEFGAAKGERDARESFHCSPLLLIQAGPLDLRNASVFANCYRNMAITGNRCLHVEN